MNKYPPGFFEKIGLKKILIGQNVAFNGEKRAAVPDNYAKQLFISFNTDYSDDYIVHCFHHELNHYTEYFLWNDYRYSWSAWPKISGGGGELAYQNKGKNWMAIDRKLVGFINPYSTLGGEEDRSEIVGYFMNTNSPDYALVVAKVRGDKALNNKVTVLLKYYKEKLQFNFLGKQGEAALR